MSPFEIFRRNLKPAMVVLTLLSLFAFVVLPAMDSYLRSGNANTTNAVVGTLDGVQLTQNRVEYFTRNHNSTVQFLHELAKQTIARNGSPRTPGFSYNSQTQQVQSVGIVESPSSFGTVRTLQLASEAGKAGFELDDFAIKTWLEQYTDGKMTQQEIMSVLAKTSRNSMGPFHLYEQLRAQLLAGLYQRNGAAGITTQQMLPLTTPAQQWTNFQKLQRKATIDAYGLLVNDFVEETDANPPGTLVQSVYDQGKSRFPDGQSAEPAFRRRTTAKFEYLVADYQSFVDREVAKLSEDEIRAEYEKQVEGGAFAMPSDAAAKMLEEAEAMKKKIEEEAAKKKSETSAAGDGVEKPATDAAEPAKTEDKTDAAEMKKDADEPKKDAAAAAVAPAEMKKVVPPGDLPADDAGVVTDGPKTIAEPKVEGDGEAILEKNKKQVEDFKKRIDAVREEAAKEVEPKADQSNWSKPNGVQLVLFQDGGQVQEGEQVGEQVVEQVVETPVVETPKPADTPAEVVEQVVETKPVVETPGSTEVVEQVGDAKPMDETKPDVTTEPAAVTKPVTETKPAAETKPAMTEGAAAAEGSEAASEGEPEAEESPKVESFEDARDRVAEGMVKRKVGLAIQESLRKAEKEMRTYFNLKAIYDTNKAFDDSLTEPVKPDLKKLGAELGLDHGTAGPFDILSMAKHELGNTNEMSGGPNAQGAPFGTIMFGQQRGQEIAAQQLYSPLQTGDRNTRRFFVTWKTEEKEAYEPTLEECRSEVVQAIRITEARKLARAAADEMVAQLNDGKTFDDLVPEDKKFNLQKDLGPFSWMQTFGFGRAFMGNVPKLDSVGEEFMSAVFSTEANQYGVASNLPERVVYVVKPTTFSPHPDDLKEIFKQPNQRRNAMMLGNEDAGSVFQGFFESMDERTGFNYDNQEE